MSVCVWRIATDTPDYTADDISGKGAAISGGRWNRPGHAMVYTSMSIALACLETCVHLNAPALPLNRYLIRLDIPSDVWDARRIVMASDLVGWDAIPEGRTSLDYGDAWLAGAEFALLAVPSVVVPEEFNVLINPAHAHAKDIVVTKVRKWTYDARITQGAKCG